MDAKADDVATSLTMNHLYKTLVMFFHIELMHQQ